MAIVAAGELFGGVERHVLDLSRALAGRGVPISLLLFHDAELAARTREAGIAPLVLPSANLATLSTARVLAAHLKRHRAHVVHAHGYKATVLSALARRHTRCALVKTEHGLPETGGPTLADLRTRLYAALDRAATRRSAATVCCVTEDLRARGERGGMAPPPCVVPNGIDPMHQLAHARPAELDHEHFNFVLVGRLDRVKGHRVALEAFAIADASTALGRRLVLHLLGQGPLEASLRRQAADLGPDLETRVRFHGFRRDAGAFIAHADALLMPSLHEGLPYTLLEAMALGTPVVASSVGGLPRVVRHMESALLVPPGDAAALARSMLRLASDAALRERLADEARRLQACDYSLDAMTDRYLDIYRSAAGLCIAPRGSAV